MVRPDGQRIILAVAVVIALLFSKVIFPLLVRVSNFTSGDLDDRVIAAAHTPLMVYIFLIGLYLAITAPSRCRPRFRTW